MLFTTPSLLRSQGDAIETVVVDITNTTSGGGALFHGSFAIVGTVNVCEPVDGVKVDPTVEPSTRLTQRAVMPAVGTVTVNCLPMIDPPKVTGCPLIVVVEEFSVRI